MQPAPASRFRALSFISGLTVAANSILLLRYFFAANYPEQPFSAFCDLSSRFNCDGFASSLFAQLGNVPVGYFGLLLGLLLCLGAVFPSTGMERTNRYLLLVNLLIACAVLVISIWYLRTLCVLWAGYLTFSLLAFVVFTRYGTSPKPNTLWRYGIDFSLPHLVVIIILGTLGAVGIGLFHETNMEARAVEQYFSLAPVKLPSFISPFWVVRSTQHFEDAPIQVLEFSDFLCDDSAYVAQQLARLERDYPGKMNVILQIYPEEALCNKVIGKDKHPGACEAAYMVAAYGPEKFRKIHDDFFAHYDAAADPAWRRERARLYGVEASMNDPAAQNLVQQMIQTGREYEPTSKQYRYGIRSTPIVILNNRMIIGTYSYLELHAIVKALLDHQQGQMKFMEEWPPTPLWRPYRPVQQ